METLRLRGIQQPSQVEKLLESYIAHAKVLPKDSYPVRDPTTLPSQLQRIVDREAEKGRTWLCWADPFNTWLFTCEMSLPLSRERGAPVLQLDLYDEAGELKESGSWMVDQGGKWRRCVA
jgi:hypothetical protein